MAKRQEKTVFETEGNNGKGVTEDELDEKDIDVTLFHGEKRLQKDEKRGLLSRLFRGKSAEENKQSSSGSGNKKKAKEDELNQKFRKESVKIFGLLAMQMSVDEIEKQTHKVMNSDAKNLTEDELKQCVKLREKVDENFKMSGMF